MMLRPRLADPALRQRGVSLIEVLVAMLIVSLGVLSVSGLLASASRYGKTSEYRAVATLLVSDIVDRIRANKAALDPGAPTPGVATAYNVTAAYETWADEPAGPVACANVDACTAAEIVAQDKAEWSQAVFRGLPGGAGFVQLSADPKANPTADVWVAWLDPAASGGEANAGDKECPPGFQQLTPQPRCAYFRVGL